MSMHHLGHHHHHDEPDVADVAASTGDIIGHPYHERIHYRGFRMILAPILAGLLIYGLAKLSTTNPDVQHYLKDHAKVARQN